MHLKILKYREIVLRPLAAMVLVSKYRIHPRLDTNTAGNTALCMCNGVTGS